jgi:predicted RND superfamily exporter protein
MRRTARYLAALLALAAAVTAVAMGLGKLRTDTTTASFVSPHDPSQKASLAAARSFGGDPVVVLAESKKSATLLGPDQITKLAALEGRLAQLPDVAVVYGPGTVLNQVAGQAQDLLATISGRRDALRAAAQARAKAVGRSPAGIVRAGNAAAVTFDARYGSLLVKGLPAGLPTLRNPGFVHAVVFDSQGQPRQQWRFVVPRPDAVAIVVRPREQLDQSATERLVRAIDAKVAGAHLKTSKVTVTGMPVVAAGLGGILRREIPVLGGLALGLIGACYFFLPWVRRRRSRLLPLLATLGATLVTLSAFGWLNHPVSLGAVAFLPIILGTGSDFPAYLVRGADRRRVVVTALAAAAGFASLGISPIPFVRDFGLALAAGVVLAVGFALVLSRGSYRARAAEAATADPTADPQDRGQVDVRREPLSVAVRSALFAAVAAVALVGWVALPHLDIEAQPEKIAQGAPALKDAEYAEGVLGAAGEVQILVSGQDVLTPRALAWMTAVQDVTLRKFGDRLHPVASPPTLLAFLGHHPTTQQVQAGLDQLPAYLRSSVIRDDGKMAVLGFGIELGDVGKQQRLLTDLLHSLPPPPAGIKVSLAGLPVVTARSYDLVSGSRYLDGLVGIGAAGLVLLIGLRRKTDALRGILAAGLATGWALAGAWLLGIPLTPLTVALGSLATATACEFTVLLGGPRGGHALLVRRSVLVAAAAATSGYLALAFSGLAVIRDFGLFLAATVLLSLLAAQVVWLLVPVRRPPAPAVAEPVESRMKVLV